MNKFTHLSLVKANNIQRLIQKLPMDIVLKIIPYTYNLQQKPLLNDIVNYNETKSFLLKKYYDFWIIEMEEPNPEEHKNWLINDIFGYANGQEALMYGYVEKFYSIFKRNTFLQTKTDEDVEKYVGYLEKKDVSTQINIFLGLFHPNERNDIVNAALEMHL